MNTTKRLTLLGIVAIFLPSLSSAADVMTIVGDQVGILTPTPAYPLDVDIGTATPGLGNGVIRMQRTGSLALQLQNDNYAHFWNFSVAGDGFFRINSSAAAGVKMSLDNSGNMAIQGSLTSGGPTCGGGCDRVFASDYELPSIDAHAKQMWENKHLPAIGPIEPLKPVNLSDQFGNMLNELETAHIYIEQLNREKDSLNRKVETLESRLSDLETLLSR